MYLKASICNKIELLLHDSKFSIPLPLSIMFVNREVQDCTAREEVIGKDEGVAIGMLLIKNYFEDSLIRH